MDWRSILKFDENLYNHTDESTKEKHQRILDFIKDRPKTKGTGLRIKEFLDSGELDESFTPLDLPRNSITTKTKEFYEKFMHPDDLLEDFFRSVKNSVNNLVSNFSNIFRVNGYEIERLTNPNDMMPLKDFSLSFSKLVKNFYYSELPNAEEFHGSFPKYFSAQEINYENTPAYKEAVENYINKFYDKVPILLLDLVEMALRIFIPTSYMSAMLSMNTRDYLKLLRE